jgi:hypothetical protein
MGIAGQINCVEPAYGLRSNSGMPEESPRRCIIATTQMFGLLSKDNEEFKDGFHALFIDSRQAIAFRP